MKARLEEMLEDVVAELKTLGIHNPQVKEDWIATPEHPVGGEADPNVVADNAEDWSERRATLALLETRYNNINRALEKIKNGNYGLCEIDGNSIEPERLEANPAARTCEKHMDEESKLTI